jgi:hypothetical protein
MGDGIAVNIGAQPLLTSLIMVVCELSQSHESIANKPETARQ